MLSRQLSHAAKYLLRLSGYEVRRLPRNRSQLDNVLPDQPQWVNDIITRVQPFTMTSPERIAALCNAVEYITQSNIPGDIVECGIWRGGSVMAAILTLLRLKSIERTFYLFDTFEGMPPPQDIDRPARSLHSAAELMATANKDDLVWAYSPLEEVRRNIRDLGYPSHRIVFVKGRVEDTLPRDAPTEIALLRLDTDWYASTRHELTYLYPNLAPRGVLIVDDYGHWEGARQATDEFISTNKLSILLTRIDYTGRMAIKV
jgi:O-methyltransferase